MLRSALVMAVPSVQSAPDQADPSACSAETRVASTPMGTPRCRGRPEATISRRRPSVACIPGILVSLRKTLSRTLAPASRNTRAHAFSTGPDRSLRRPEREHDVRWSPSSSTVARHDFPRHLLGTTARGHRKRRRRATCMRSGVSVVPVHFGRAASHRPAEGPDCERSIAC